MQSLHKPELLATDQEAVFFHHEHSRLVAHLKCSVYHYRAQIGGIALEELNALELDFLFAIDFDLGVHPADYAACTADLRAFVFGPADNSLATYRRAS